MNSDEPLGYFWKGPITATAHVGMREPPPPRTPLVYQHCSECLCIKISGICLSNPSLKRKNEFYFYPRPCKSIMSLMLASNGIPEEQQLFDMERDCFATLLATTLQTSQELDRYGCFLSGVLRGGAMTDLLIFCFFSEAVIASMTKAWSPCNSHATWAAAGR